MSPHPRSLTYYWKCDRPAAFHGTAERDRDNTGIEGPLRQALQRCFPGEPITVRPVASQGNHLTFLATIAGAERFVRVEDGPEQDDYIEVESHVLDLVRKLHVPAPRVYAVDASRREAPFAWQLMDRVDCGDLNQLLKAGTLDLPFVAMKIGAALATWQSLRPAGFGPFDPAVLFHAGRLQGFHTKYADYFHTQLERHLDYLVDQSFLSQDEADEMRREIDVHRPLLDLAEGCLVHKDLALWNILGTTNEIAAFIDWDDCIAGDSLDDLSLLACFHDAATMACVIEGYTAIRPLAEEHRRRFWLHLLRNMIVKSVIRVGAGYFDRTDQFFLIDAGGTGADLRRITRERLATALRGLRNDSPLSELGVIA